MGYWGGGPLAEDQGVVRNWVCLVGELLVNLPRVFCTILEPTNNHKPQSYKIFRNHKFNYFPCIISLYGDVEFVDAYMLYEQVF